MMKNFPIIVITGPTASGKTTLAIELAKKIGAEIICADSRIVYKELDIVSAKPSSIEKNGIVHHLIDIKTIDEGMFSAGEFSKLSKKIIKSSNCPIIIQGGTWFYIKSLLSGEDLFEYGQNKELRAVLNKKTNDELFEILKSKDEKRANVVHKNNRDKIIRSIELIEAIKGKLSETKRPKNEEFKAIWYIKDITRENLYKKINQRTDDMMSSGLYEEWEKVYKRYGRNDILYNTIGYREFFDMEDKIYPDLASAVEKIKQHTRNFAKRQLSWFNQNAETFNIKKINSINDIDI